MALKHTLATIILASSFMVADFAFGQLAVPGPNFRHRELEQPGSTRPLAEPGVFNYDAQMFAPLEFTNNKEKSPNTGFFFTYDRTYTSIGLGGQVGPIANVAYPLNQDWVWGNRYEGGWMGEEDNGWDVIYQQNLGSFFASGTDVLVATPLLVNTSYAMVDINKTYRQALSNGDYIEPFFGIKYVNVSDNSLEDTTTNFNGVASFNRFKQNVTNNAVGFQAGGRYSAYRGRYRMTLNGAMVAAYNNQKYFATDILTVNAAVGVSEFNQQDQAFVPAFDGNVELAYNLSRDFAIRGTFQLQYYWAGIARSNNLTTALNPNSVLGPGQDLQARGLFDTSFIAPGFTFGVEWRR